MFSIFETHTRWIAKGKAGTPVELGVPVCVCSPYCPPLDILALTNTKFLTGSVTQPPTRLRRPRARVYRYGSFLRSMWTPLLP